MLTHGSLFSGIGGFEEGAKLAGIPTIWNCEYEAFQRKILLKNFPETKQYEDIRTMSNAEYVDIISGGFPCQDISVAGNGIGISGERSGLWAEMFRIIRHVRPRYAIIENSPALTIRGFEYVLSDLYQIGYDAEWQCISNVSFGYPHRRERIYTIAYPHQIGLQSDIQGNGSIKPVFRKWASKQVDGYFSAQRIHEIPTSSIIRNGDGFSNWSHRVGSIGNAVNPVVARYLFECIKIHDSEERFY